MCRTFMILLRSGLRNRSRLKPVCSASLPTPVLGAITGDQRQDDNIAPNVWFAVYCKSIEESGEREKIWCVYNTFEGGTLFEKRG